MEITGLIIKAMPEVNGTSAKGNPWKKREYVLETQETYPKKVFFNFFGDRADQYPLEVGKNYKVSFDIDSHEYNSRWFVEIRAWKAEEVNAAQASQVAPPPAVGGASMPNGYGASAPVPAPPAPDLSPSPTDDLPF